MAHLGTDTSSWWWQEVNAPSHTSRRTKAFLKEREIQLLTWPPCSPDLSPLEFHLWQEGETALGERQFQSQLELRAMIVRTMSDLDPIAAEKACTNWFIHRCLALVRPVLKQGPKSLTVGPVFFWVLKPASALNAPAWTSAQATDCDLKSRSCKTKSVWGLSVPSPSPSLPSSPPSSCFTHNHHHHYHSSATF